MSTPTPTADIINYQTNQINAKITEMKEEAIYQSKKYEYQAQSYASVNKVKKMFTFVFYLFLAGYNTLLIWRHIKGTRTFSFLGFDMFMLIVLASFPFWVLFIEEVVYKAFAYTVALIKNTIFINNFYTIFNNTDFYYKPDTTRKT